MKKNKFTNDTVSVLGISVKEGQKLTGVEQAPALFRKGGLLKAINSMGWKIKDHGDITRESIQKDLDEEYLNEKEYLYDNLANIEVLGVMNRELSRVAKESSSKGQFFLALGGDHGLATGSISGMLETYPDLKVIWIDAQGDCNTPEISPSGNYHGMPVAHLFGWMPQGSVKGFDWLKVTLKLENIVYIGLRDLDQGEKELMEKYKIKFYTPYDIDRVGGIGKVMDEALRYLQADEMHKNPIHISFDVDGCDPSFMPATGTKARCGLSEREAHFILQRAYNTGNLVSLDMVEVNPTLEKSQELREVYHGDNKLLVGTQTVAHAMEFVLSALGFSWRY